MILQSGSCGAPWAAGLQAAPEARGFHPSSVFTKITLQVRVSSLLLFRTSGPCAHVRGLTHIHHLLINTHKYPTRNLSAGDCQESALLGKGKAKYFGSQRVRDFQKREKPLKLPKTHTGVQMNTQMRLHAPAHPQAHTHTHSHSIQGCPCAGSVVRTLQAITQFP